MSGKTKQASVWITGVLFLTVTAVAAYRLQSRRSPTIPTIAFIPPTAGSMLWEVEHFGATMAAEEMKCRLYWNAPTSESDMAGQVSLIDRVGRGKYQGLVLAPNHTLGIRAPLNRVLAAGLPVVIVASLLDIPSGNKLAYIVNDDEKMGEFAAAELARLIDGKGSVALVGLARFAPGVALRVRGAERVLATRFPGIHVVSRTGGANNTPRSEGATNSALDSHPEIKAILSFTAGSTRGVHSVLKSRALQHSIRLVGCEQDSDLIGYVGSGEIAAVLAENTYRMGYEAVGLISGALAGKPMPAKSMVPPLLITKQNFHSAEADLFTGFPR